MECRKNNLLTSNLVLSIMLNQVQWPSFFKLTPQTTPIWLVPACQKLTQKHPQDFRDHEWGTKACKILDQTSLCQQALTLVKTANLTRSCPWWWDHSRRLLALLKLTNSSHRKHLRWCPPSSDSWKIKALWFGLTSEKLSSTSMLASR